MTAVPPNPPEFNPPEDSLLQEMIKRLRRKEGVWADWARDCQRLQKLGMSPQQIFEATGFEPIQQNQIIVAEQVLATILSHGVAPEVQARFERTGSDSLYEFRILNQADRAAAATLVVEQGIDSEGAREVAKALKDFSRLATPPEEFPSHPGDAIAFYYWKLARQQSDLQARSRLIALGLRFATSESARRQIEKLLTDFTVAPSKQAPILPIYRLETQSEVPRILPVVGKLPLATADLKAVPLIEEEGPFRLVKFSGTGAWLPVPGWQVVFAAEDPVVLLADLNDLPTTLEGASEEVVVMIDRAERTWDDRSYFAVDRQGEIQIQWFEQEPTLPILGRVILVLRPKKVLDEDYNKDLWQIDE